MDNMTINDREKEKNSKVNEDSNVDKEIEELWQKWSTDRDSDFFTVADLLQDMACTPTPIATATLTLTASTSSTSATGRRKKLTKRKKKQALTRANPVLKPDYAVDSTRFVLVSNKALPASSNSDT